MKIAYNRNYGGWGSNDDGVIEEWKKEKQCRINAHIDVDEDSYSYFDADAISRTDPLLISLIEKRLSKYAGLSFYEKIKKISEEGSFDMGVVEIPDEATDYLITEYDGAESVYYVLNGKIHHAV